jgi:hypothetical protein
MKKQIKLLIFMIFMWLTLTVQAVSKPTTGIQLFAQPNAQSQVIATIPQGQPIIPIYTEKDWSKIADPSNGNVGWVNNETLKQQGMIFTKTITKSVSTPNETNTQVINYSGHQVVDEKQVQELMNNWQKTQENLSKTFNQMMNQSIEDINRFLQQFNAEQAPKNKTLQHKQTQ